MFEMELVDHKEVHRTHTSQHIFGEKSRKKVEGKQAAKNKNCVLEVNGTTYCKDRDTF
jgi:hypothetical protein